MVSKFITRQGAFPQLGIKAPCVTVATENIVLSGLYTLDDVDLGENDRVLVINQSDPATNGIYNADTGLWPRSPDWNLDVDVTSGVMIVNTNRAAMYIASFEGGFIIDTTVVTFNQVYGTVATAAAGENTYNPGYGVTYISASSFKIDGFDVTPLYYVGRRLRLVGANGLDFHGVIATSVFGADTTITMTMEGADIVPIDIISAVLVSSDTQWVRLAVNNHLWRASVGGVITSGRIGINDWWVIVGDNRQIHVSKDAGATWTAATIAGLIPATVNINDVAYDSDNQRFMAVADDTWILTSGDGVNWASSQPSDLTAAISSGTGHLGHVAFGFTLAGSTNGFALYGSFGSAVNSEIYTSIDNGANWISRSAVTNTAGLNRFRYNPNNDRYFTCSAPLNTASILPGTWTVTSEDSGANSFDIDFIASGANAYAACQLGQVRRGTANGTGTWVDSTGADPFGTVDDMLGIALSPTLGGPARVIAVGENSKLGYTDDGVNWTLVANGFNPTASILDVHWDANDALFIAISNDGHICRSTNGTN